MKLTDAQVIAAIQQEEASSYGLLSSELQEQREQAMDRYLGRPYGDEQEGRSQIVSSDIADAVEWVLPSLLKIFISGDEIVRFDAKGPEDEQQAEQESDYINNIVIERNQAFVVFNEWFKDALLQKNGYVKAYWHTRDDVKTETYQGLSQEELDYILKDQEVEVIGQAQYPDPAVPPIDPMMAMQAQAMGQELPPPPMLTDVKIRRKFPQEFVKFEAVPPEEVLVSTKARAVSLQGAPFCEHRRKMTISALRQMGYDVPEDIGDDTSDETESNARNRFGEDSYNTDGADQTMREVWYRECWMRIDCDGDGTAELRRICVVGNTVLHNEETEVVNLAALTPILMPHRHIGVSYFDLIQDLARIKTTILRNLLDNLYLQNNTEKAVDRNTVNIEDMLISRPGGIKRVDGPPGMSIMPIVTPDTSGAALQGLEYIDAVKENRTGVTKYNQGLDANSLNKTASGINQIMTASQQRIEMIARCFAETGVRELFWLVHKLTLQHSSKAEKVKLRNKWVVVNPREWVDRYNLSINVGLGTGNKDQMLMHLQMILGMQQQAMTFGLTDLSKVRNTLGKITQNAGFKNAEMFWSEIDPSAPPPQPPPPPEVQAAQITAEAEKELTKMQSEIKHGADMQIAAATAETQKQLAEFKFRGEMQLKEMEIASRERIALAQEETRRMIGMHSATLKHQHAPQ